MDAVVPPGRGSVVNVGALMSHAIIVSRELGIPCAVSVEGATERIADGDMIEVDERRRHRDDPAAYDRTRDQAGHRRRHDHARFGDVVRQRRGRARVGPAISMPCTTTLPPCRSPVPASPCAPGPANPARCGR
jgi:phosphoenolpyruvate-protein kinase (PTS system EI component)